MQSPIDLSQRASIMNRELEIRFALEPDNLTFISNTGALYSDYSNGLVQVDHSGGNQVIYQTANIHFHVPSEHTFEGDHYDAEIYFPLVDTNYPTSRAVLSIPIKRDRGES